MRRRTERFILAALVVPAVHGFGMFVGFQLLPGYGFDAVVIAGYLVLTYLIYKALK